MAKITAFIARSFDPDDERKLKPILDFLDSFRKMGFICITADRAEVESVSDKVRRMIDGCDVLVGIFTRRHPVVNWDTGWKGLIERLTGNIRPEFWTAPPWVLQESGYALCAGRDLILLREDGVEVPGLQGDLEYVSFGLEDSTAALSKISEMVNDILAKKTGTTVDVVVESRAAEPPVVAEASPLPAADETLAESSSSSSSSSEPALIDYLIRMSLDAGRRDLQELYASYTDACAFLENSTPDDVDRLEIDCYYNYFRFQAGAADGLDRLRELRESAPQRPEPEQWIACSLFESKEYEEAGRHYIIAASLSERPGNRSQALIRAAECFLRANNVLEGKKVAYEAVETSSGDERMEALSVLYDLLKREESIYAFATAEAALHENPQHSLRFKLGLDYHAKNLHQLFLHHFTYQVERNPDDGSSMHNLALAYSECKLPISAVARYKRAFSMGVALSAANLGFDYLAAGMADEARATIAQAMKIEGHEQRVEKCLADIGERTEEEHRKADEILASVSNTRNALIEIGGGLRRKLEEPIDGTWRFPFGEMELTVRGGVLRGTAERSIQEDALFKPGEKAVRTERRTLVGSLSGSACKFQIDVDAGHSTGVYTASTSLAALMGGANKKVSGYLVFSADGLMAQYCEVEDYELRKIQTLARV